MFGGGETSREYRWLLQQFFWKKWPYATKRAEVSSAHLSLKVVTRWSKSSPNVVFELSHVSPKFLKDVSKFCQSCVIVLPKLCRRCVQVVTKLYLSCIQVVSKLSPSCVQVVVESKILWRPKHFFSRRSPSPLTPVDVWILQLPARYRDLKFFLLLATCIPQLPERSVKC